MNILNLKLGDAPKTAATIEKAKARYMNAMGWTATKRDDAMNEGAFLLTGYIQTAPMFDKAMVDLSRFELDLAETYQINAFNAQLAAYRAAKTRLGRHVLADGQLEVIEEFDPETGEPLTEPVVVQQAIEPLDATVVITEYDEEGAAMDFTVANPLIAIDEAQRDHAQSVIDATPEGVIAYAT